MNNTLSLDELQDAIAYLRSIEGVDDLGEPLGLILPYNKFPGSFRGGVIPLTVREKWEAYRWNPPEFLPDYTESQEGASSKPPYEVIEDAIEPGYLLRVKPRLVAEASRECRRRITAAYGESTTEDEGFSRLQALEAGAAPDLVAKVAAGNAERDRLRSRFKALKGNVEAATSKDALDAIDIMATATWTAAD